MMIARGKRPAAAGRDQTGRRQSRSEMMQPSHARLRQAGLLIRRSARALIDHDLRARLEAADYLDRSAVVESAHHGNAPESFSAKYPEAGDMVTAPLRPVTGVAAVVRRKA